MHLIKKSQQKNTKSPDFRQQYTSQNTSRPSQSSRLNIHAQKRFKRNTDDKSNHSRSSSKYSQNSISKFYVKNIVSLLPTNIITGPQNSVKMNIPQIGQRNTIKSPKQITLSKSPLNFYGLGRQESLKNKNEQKVSESRIDVTSFLKRQYSPPIVAKTGHQIKPNDKFVKAIQDSYNFLSPMSKKHISHQQQSELSKQPKQLLQQLTKQRNKTAELTLQLQKCKNNQKKLNLLNEQLQLKAKRLSQKISNLEQQINRSNTNSVKLKQQNHRMKVLVRQRDSLMTSLMEKQQNFMMKKQNNSQNINNKINSHDQNLVTKLIQYEYENQKLRDTIYKLKKQCQQNNFQLISSTLMVQTPSQLNGQSMSSEITWDDRQFSDCLQQKQKQIIELRQEIKNLQIEINYINRKWANQIERAKKIQKLEFIKLKDKYKELLLKYKQNMKLNYVCPPSRDHVNNTIKESTTGETNKNKTKQTDQIKQNGLNPQQLSPRRRKRNYTVDHLKGRGIMSDIKINYGHIKIGSPYQQTQSLQLLEYSSCEEEI